ncbi:MAG: isoprenylcysteine carboxyl methyltransferase [Proteobacteria bacterium]|nr:isoprenylcysteine carboxyl methyltransferase [Pseudomonadota bacterium]
MMIPETGPLAPQAQRLAPGPVNLRSLACNLGLAACYLLFSWGMLQDFMATHRFSSLILTVFESLIVFYSLFRPAPKQANTSLYDWSVALAGTYIPLLLRPAPQVHDHPAIIAVQLVGMSISLAALFSLNKSFGLVAANRGVKRGGLYGVVRHPIYAGYFISFAAYVTQNPTGYNAALYAVFVCLELLRVAAEERVLSGDPEYVSYARSTRWRVVPFVY